MIVYCHFNTFKLETCSCKACFLPQSAAQCRNLYLWQAVSLRKCHQKAAVRSLELLEGSVDMKQNKNADQLGGPRRWFVPSRVQLIQSTAPRSAIPVWTNSNKQCWEERLVCKQFCEVTESGAAHPAACSAPEGGDSALTYTPPVYLLLYCRSGVRTSWSC